jgi:hypothetical protein
VNEIDARFREEVSRLLAEKSQLRPLKRGSRKGGLHRKEEQEYFSLRYTP